MKPNFLNRFMKKLTRERVVPNISARGLLTDLRDYWLGHSFLTKMSEHKKDTRQSLFAGVKQLVDQILFVADVAREQISHEHIGKSVFAIKRFHHRLLLNPQKLAVCHCSRRSHTESLACQRAFTKEIPLAQCADRCFLAGLRDDGEPDLAFLDIEHSVSDISLGEDPSDWCWETIRMPMASRDV